MRILILTNFGLGLYKFRKELIEKLCETNDVIIALPEGDFITELKEIGCKYIKFEFNRRGMNPFDDFGQILRYKKLIKDLDPHVVLTYTIKPNIYGGIACQLCHVPYIVNVTGLGTSIENGGLLGLISTSLYKIGLRKADCVFFQNQNNQQLFKKKKIVTGKTKLIPGSGVNLSAHCVEEYPNDTEGLRFLFIGRIMKDKGIDELIGAIKEIHNQYPSVSLDIVGGCDENYENLLEDTCKNGFVRYHGQQKDVHQFIREAHCTVLPSYHEGTANVILESASTGRPVITTRVPGCIETFDEGISGLGCKAKDIETLVDAMKKFIGLSWEDRKEMGLNGRRKMEQEFDRNIVIEAYLTELNNINDRI